ncbi:hypothetical protein M404DRAFT_32657 [Pisolithus tinctorius Marx 270]|uniref:Uncharacterized protein n=1 Tax=Pisolithus tinctorius Marx 270 TaxID=870435 RepID=A0A0C3NN58_PISTI|nr:hypothetical protein M404DRAFT_32657 [Pisolithus tinctorius Marx 270]
MDTYKKHGVTSNALRIPPPFRPEKYYNCPFKPQLGLNLMYDNLIQLLQAPTTETELIFETNSSTFMIKGVPNSRTPPGADEEHLQRRACPSSAGKWRPRRLPTIGLLHFHEVPGVFRTLAAGHQ